MVSPNWPSEDDPNFTPDFADSPAEFDFGDSSYIDLDDLREGLDDLVEDD